MAVLDKTIEKLKKAIQRSKSKRKNDHAGTLDQVTSYLIFLKSTNVSSDAAGKLSGIFRRQLPVLYTAFPQLSLALTAVLCQIIYEEKILKDFTAGKLTEDSPWQSVLNALLSGVLDHLEEETNEKFKEAVGVSLYPVLCSIFLSASISHMSVELRCTGYSVLSDSAEMYRTNQKRLLNADILGGIKLGSMLWRTKDYLVLESILNLFARMIPPSGSSAVGRMDRRAFIRSVFVESSPDDVKTGEELADMVEHVSTPVWEETAAKIVDALADSNIGFPQPFKVSEMFVGEEPKPSDRIYVDAQGLLANVLVEGDLFDSLIAPYSTVSKIEVARRSVARKEDRKQPSARINVALSSPPTIGQKPVHTTPTLSFMLDEDDVQRLHSALNSRGMGHVMYIHSSAKQSVLKSPAALEIDLAGNLIGKQELEQRIETLSQLYETNDASDDNHDDGIPASEHISCIDPALLTLAPPQNTVPVADPDKFAASGSASGRESLSVSAFTTVPTAAANDGPTPPVSAPVTPIRRTASQVLRDTAFGTSDDELSPVECLPEPPKVPRKSVSNVIPKVSSKVTTARRTNRRTVLDSDDEMPVSTPSRPPAKKKVTMASDDEIEEVLSSAKAVVSRRRSVLSMTAMAASGLSSSSHRRSVQPKAFFGRKKSARAVKDSLDDEPIVLDSSAPKLSPQDTRETATARKATAENIPAEVQSTTERKVQNNQQVRLSSPPVQPAKKPIKAALRKKNLPIEDSPPEPVNVRGSKRKRPVDSTEVVDGQEERAQTKRTKLDPVPGTVVREQAPTKAAESHAFKPDLSSTGRAKKHYGGRKKLASPPLAPAQPDINYDEIPGSAVSSAKPLKAGSATKPSSKTSKPKKAVKKAPSQESKVSTKTTRSTVAKGKETNTKVAAEAVPEKTRVSARKAKAHANVDDDQQANAHVSINEAQKQQLINKVLKKKPSEPEELDEWNLKKSSGANANEGTPSVPRKPFKDVISAKKSNEAPWESLTKKAPAVVSNDATAKEDAIDYTPRPELSEPVDVPEIILIDDNVIIALDDFETQTVAESTPAKLVTRPELRQSPDGQLNKPAAKVAPDERLTQSPKRLQPERVHAKHISSADYEEVINSATPENMHVEPAIPAPEILEQKPLPAVHSRSKVSASAIKAKAPLRPVAPPIPSVHKHLESPSKTVLKKTRFEYADERTMKPLDAPPGMEDLANALQDIQQALLHKITNKVEGVKHDMLRGRELMLEEAAADLASMRAESVDRYNHLIGLEAGYASFGRALTHALEDLVSANQDIHADIVKVIQTHDRSSIVKKAPTSLFPTKLPASIKRFCP